jgi:hypothetical protein
MHLHQVAHQRQADAEPALGAVQLAVALHEQVEDVRQQGRRDAVAVVGDLDLHARAHACAWPA